MKRHSGRATSSGRQAVKEGWEPPPLALSPDAASRGGVSLSHPAMSTRERQVLGLIEQGLTAKEIATKLGIALSTVGQHTHHLLLKLGASNRTQLAVIAVRLGMGERSSALTANAGDPKRAPGGRGAGLSD